MKPYEIGRKRFICMRTETAVCLGGGGTHTVHKEKNGPKGNP